jgi:hypothetical protein
VGIIEGKGQRGRGTIKRRDSGEREINRERDNV